MEVEDAVVDLLQVKPKEKQLQNEKNRSGKKTGIFFKFLGKNIRPAIFIES